jgi:alkanesulfonate monooxygenase SsuD/methylene tetrahydromethanopterin reductase-like flavin-dependent oxidoreductase (luciferase family)
MQFGLNFFPCLSPAEKPATQYFREAMQLISLADELGYRHIRQVEHYFDPYGGYSPNPIVFLAAAAQRTVKARLATGAVLPAFNNPLKLAGEIAMLDGLSGGRVDAGFARAFLPHEFRTFGISLDESRARFNEGLAQVKLLLERENVSSEGQFHSFRNVTSYPRPTQKPHPPIWIAANADPAVVRTARLGLSWFINPHAPLPTIERQWDRYKQALAEANQPMPAARPIALEVHVAPTREEAIATAQPFLEAKYEAYAQWGQDKALPGEESFRVPFEDLARDRFVLGTPDEVIEQIEGRIRRLDANYLIFRMGWPGMEGNKVLRVIEMMGEKVLPYFHQKYGRG